MEKQPRQSNFEFLRILSIAMIVAFHSIYFTKFSFDNEISANKLLYDVLYYCGELGVNCFILIGGYFLPVATFKWKKLALIILQIYFYFYGCRIATILFTKAPVDSYNLSSWFFPVLQGRYWFLSAYILVYILTPFLQKLISQTSKKEFEILICSQFLIWSAFPTIFLTAVGRMTESMNFYNRYIWMILLYFVGAYIRIYGLSVFGTAKKSILIFVTTSFILFSYIFLIEILFHDTKTAIKFWGANSLFQVILSLSLFCIFKNLSIESCPKINRVATCVLGIYLLHDGPFSGNIWHKVFVLAEHENDTLFFARILFAVVLLMLAGIFVELCRQPFEKYISGILDKIKIEFNCRKIL